MHTEHDVQEKSATSWAREDFLWVLSLFGTAVGAGILFLPIGVGIAGLWPLVFVTLISCPMVYYAHRGLSRFTLSSARSVDGITNVVDEHFGKTAGLVITLLYFCSIFPIVLIYAVGITGVVNSFIINQLGAQPPSTVLLSALLIAGFILCILAGEKVMLKITEWIVYPLIVSLLFLSLYLIPHWNLSLFREASFSLSGASLSIWAILPVIAFSFNHSPIISSFSMAQRRRYGPLAEAKASQILKATAACLWIFVMLFVISCVLSLTPADLQAAKKQNLSVLSYLANTTDSGFISYFGPLIAFTAIASSYFGHYLGAVEGLKGLLARLPSCQGKNLESKKVDIAIAVFMFLLCWVTAVANPGILGVIETISGPVVALILFVTPMYAVYTVPGLARFRGGSSIFVLVLGVVIALSAFLNAFR